jgi:hypothetical protein
VVPLLSPSVPYNLTVTVATPGEVPGSEQDTFGVTGIDTSTEGFTGMRELFDNPPLLEDFFGLFEPVSFDPS